MKRKRLQRSSADKLLRGMTYQGKKITGVFKGKHGTTRILRFQDRSQKKVHRQVIHRLAQLQGLLQYRAKYAAASASGKRQMLRKSAGRQHAMVRNFVTRQEKAIASMPRSLRRGALAALGTVKRNAKRVGSPLIGHRPAYSIIDHGENTFRIAKHAGVRVRTKRGRTLFG